MKNKIFPTFLVFFFLSIFFIFFKGLQNSNIYTPNTNLEKNIPSFVAEIFDTDNDISSEEIFEKKIFYLMNIWASWCVPCREEHPFLMNLSDEKNIQIIGINYKDNNVKAKSFLTKLDNPYDLIISDKDGTLSIEWGAYGVPESFLIYNKKIIKKIIGPIDKNLFLEVKELVQ